MLWTATQVAAWVIAAPWPRAERERAVAHVLWTSRCDDQYQVPAGDRHRAREAGLAGIDVVRHPPPAGVDVWHPVENVAYAARLWHECGWLWAWHAGDWSTMPDGIGSMAARALRNPSPTMGLAEAAERAVAIGLSNRAPDTL